MTAPAASWQLDRLSTSAREAAEIASLGAGLSLSSWLTRLIGDTCAAEGAAPPSEGPKILEFTRDLRERPPAAAMSSAAMPPAPVAPTPVPPPAMPAFQPSAIPPALQAPTLQSQASRPSATPAPAGSLITNLMSIAAARLHAPPPIAPVAEAPIVLPSAPAQAAPFQDAPVQIQPSQVQPAQVPPSQVQPAAPSQPAMAAGVTMLPVTAIVSAKLGSRRGEDIPEPLLADIATRGVRQPITVRRSASDPAQHEVICGHRRWRAAQRIGLSQVPAIIVTQDDGGAILSSLAENMLQNNLSVLDESLTYLRLLTQCGMDASIVTAAIGRDRKHVVQTMRLLGLPPLVRHLAGSGMLSREHAYLLLDAPQPEVLADAILAENLSVEAARQRIPGTAGAELKP